MVAVLLFPEVLIKYSHERKIMYLPCTQPLKISYGSKGNVQQSMQLTIFTVNGLDILQPQALMDHGWRRTCR